jgi:hypothetical protein
VFGVGNVDVENQFQKGTHRGEVSWPEVSRRRRAAAWGPPGKAAESPQRIGSPNQPKWSSVTAGTHITDQSGGDPAGWSLNR